MWKVAAFDISRLCRGRGAAEDLVAVRVATEGGDDRAHLVALRDQPAVDWLKVGWGVGRNVLAQADKAIDAVKVAGPSQCPSGWVWAILNQGDARAR